MGCLAAGCSFEPPPALDDGGTGDDDGTGEQFVLSVATTGDGTGRVTATVDGAAISIDCGSDCSDTLPAGSVVELHAEPGADSAFVGWSGGCTGIDCTVTLLTATTVTAEFRMTDCTPSTTVCSSDTTVVCDAQGHATFTDCRDQGCWDSGQNQPADTGDRCADLDPSNGLADYLDMTPSASDIDLADGATINTDTGIIVSGGGAVTVPSFTVSQQGTNVEIRVFVAKNLVLRNTTVSGGRALAFVADGAIQVIGLVKASATYGTPGPGGTSDSTRCTAAAGESGGGTGIGTGGGGGGHAIAGGNAGGAFTGVGIGGAAITTELEPLVGGCIGAKGASNVFGGGGGGAIQLVSRTSISVAVVGTSVGKLHVGGGGGAINDDTEAYKNGGGGGGAGGGVLLEAPIVVVAGSGAIVAANGGGAGDGGCHEGLNATETTSQAAGGAGCASPYNVNYTRGGAGATGALGAGNGVAVSGTYGASGGGGGGRGYLVVRNTAAQFAPQDGAAVSAKTVQLPLRKRARP